MHNTILSNTWLKHVIRLMEDKEFEEAIALADYFPDSQGRRFAQCAAFAAIGEFDKSNDQLSAFSPKELHLFAPEFAVLANTLNLSTLQIANKIVQNQTNTYQLGYLCIEADIANHEQVDQKAADFLLKLGALALEQENLELGLTCLGRVIELEQSTTHLIKCTVVALTNRTSKTNEQLLSFANSIIFQALDQTPEEDLDGRLKLAKVMVIDISTFHHGLEIFRKIIKRESMKTKVVSDLLVPLLYKPYFEEIVDFLLEIDPANITRVSENLVAHYKRSRETAYLDKAGLILDQFDVQSGHEIEYARAVLIMGKQSQAFELHATRVAVLQINNAQLNLNFAKELLSQKTNDFELVQQFLELSLSQDTRRRKDVIALYTELSKAASTIPNEELRQIYNEKAAEISKSFNDFLLGIDENLSERLVIFLNNNAVESQPWYSKRKEDKSIKNLIKTASPGDRVETLVRLIDLIELDSQTHGRILKWLEWLFATDLQLTRWNVRRIREKLDALPQSFSQHIATGLEKQEAQYDSLQKDKRRSHMAHASQPIRHYHSNEAYMFQQDIIASQSESSEIKQEALPEIERFERFTRIDFPEKCGLEKKISLKIQLHQNAPQVTRLIQKIHIGLDSTTKQSVLDIHISASNFAVQPWHKKLIVPADGDSEEVEFILFPLKLGREKIEIEFFQKGSRIGFGIVETEVTSWYTSNQPASIRLMEDPLINLEPGSTGTDLDQKPATRGLIMVSNVMPNRFQSTLIENEKLLRRTLHVQWIESRNLLAYTIYSQDKSEFGEWEKQTPRLKDNIEGELRELNAFLTEIVEQGNPTDTKWNSICLNLESIGKKLFNTLIPNKVSNLVKNWKSGSTVIVSTNEEWIPWELLHDGIDFWGKRFILARYPRVPERKNLSISSRHTDGTRHTDGNSVKRRVEKIINVVGGNIAENESQRATNLFSNLSHQTQITILKEEPVSVLKEALANSDALHLTCHGFISPHILQISKDKSRIQNLLPDTIANLGLQPGGLVFANACASTVPVLTFGRFSSFGWKFYEQGAGIFIGTLGAVPTKYAVEFAEQFYDLLLNSEGDITVGEALAKTKESISNKRNLFWLLYCVFGDPDIHFSL